MTESIKPGEAWSGPGSPINSWWRSLSSRSRYEHAIIVGPRKCGKSTWFTRLERSAEQTVRVWNVRGLARATSTDKVWESLFARLGGLRNPDLDPLDSLDDYLDKLESGVTLVVDDWDAAVDGRDAATSDACYEVLDALARYCLEQAVQRPIGACLGLVLVTSLPDVVDLEYFSRAVQRATFERLSMLITRSFQAHRFPMLDRAGAGAVLAELGVPEPLVGAVADECGGWLWLLLEAADVVNAAEEWSDRERLEIIERRIPKLLEASLLRYLAARPEVAVLSREPMSYLTQELARNRDPHAFGLPTRFNDEKQLAPLLDRLLRRSFMVVDTENVRIPFQHHAEVNPDLYPTGVDTFLQYYTRKWLEQIQADTGTVAQDIWLVGRSNERINATVGLSTPGMRIFLSSRLRAKTRRQEADSTDDALLTGLVTQHVERYPLARFVMVSGDADGPLVLEVLGVIEPVAVYTPWQAGTGLKQLLPLERIHENSFPVPRPPEVSFAELREARRRRASGSSSVAGPASQCSE